MAAERPPVRIRIPGIAVLGVVLGCALAVYRARHGAGRQVTHLITAVASPAPTSGPGSPDPGRVAVTGPHPALRTARSAGRALTEAVVIRFQTHQEGKISTHAVQVMLLRELDRILSTRLQLGTGPERTAFLDELRSYFTLDREAMLSHGVEIYEAMPDLVKSSRYIEQAGQLRGSIAARLAHLQDQLGRSLAFLGVRLENEANQFSSGFGDPEPMIDRVGELIEAGLPAEGCLELARAYLAFADCNWVLGRDMEQGLTQPDSSALSVPWGAQLSGLYLRMVLEEVTGLEGPEAAEVVCAALLRLVDQASVSYVPGVFALARVELYRWMHRIPATGPATEVLRARLAALTPDPAAGAEPPRRAGGSPDPRVRVAAAAVRDLLGHGAGEDRVRQAWGALRSALVAAGARTTPLGSLSDPASPLCILAALLDRASAHPGTAPKILKDVEATVLPAGKGTGNEAVDRWTLQGYILRWTDPDGRRSMGAYLRALDLLSRRSYVDPDCAVEEALLFLESAESTVREVRRIASLGGSAGPTARHRWSASDQAIRELRISLFSTLARLVCTHARRFVDRVRKDPADPGALLVRKRAMEVIQQVSWIRATRPPPPPASPAR